MASDCFTPYYPDVVFESENEERSKALDKQVTFQKGEKVSLKICGENSRTGVVLCKQTGCFGVVSSNQTI